MKIRTLSRSSGKYNFDRDETLDLPDDEAKMLIDRKYAVALEDAVQRPKVVQTRGNNETGNTSTTTDDEKLTKDGTTSDGTADKRPGKSRRAKKSD